MFNSQIIISNSDGIKHKSVIIKNVDANIILTKENFYTYKADNNDKVLYKNKVLDFAILNDTLLILDEIKEINEVHLTKINTNNKIQKSIRSNKKNVYSEIFANNLIATYINVHINKPSYIKSITFYPYKRLFKSNNSKGNINIKLFTYKNGFPSNDELLNFNVNVSDIKSNGWEIKLPKIIKYPNDGFFITFFYSNTTDPITLQLNDMTNMFMYYPKEELWKEMNFNGFMYKLKLLQ